MDRFGEYLRFSAHHPVSGTGSEAEVSASEVREQIDAIIEIAHVVIAGVDGTSLVEFGRSQLSGSHARPGYLSVWVRPKVLDRSRHSGEGWFVNVPIAELEAVLRRESQ